MKEEALDLDAIFSDFENCAPSRNGGHLEFTEFFHAIALDILQTHWPDNQLSLDILDIH